MKIFVVINANFANLTVQLKKSLERHILTVHENIRDFLCQFCKKAFLKKDHLKRHIQTVHEKKRDFECDICNKSFTTSSSLKTHITKIHKDL